MSRKPLCKTAFALLSLALGGPASFAATLTVGKPNTSCPNAKYATIAEAVNAAASGDVIEICPAVYQEQLVIGKPLTLRGVSVNGLNRVLLQPSSMANAGALPFQAVIAVVNTAAVTIENLAIDAGRNSVSGCGTGLAGIHYYNSSGRVTNNAISGARLSDPTSCAILFPGNGFGVHIDKDPGFATPIQVSVWGNSISNFTRNGILVAGTGVTADIDGNSISGVGPGTGTFQFGVFLANGAAGHVTGNIINQGTCGPLSLMDCFALRSEGVVLRSAGDGTVVDGNMITNTQSAIFLNGAKYARITNNVIRNVDALSGIHLQATTDSVIAGNRIFNVGPISKDISDAQEGCGINGISGAGNARNTLSNNSITDAYCGVAYVSADWVESGAYFNTLYTTLNSDNYPTAYPPVEP